jgi:preprotein translocase, secY subunit
MKWFKTKQVRNRIFYTILMLIIFQLGTFLVLPGIKTYSSDSNTLSSLLNLTSGGTLSRFGFLALGVSPYITASIVVQILSKGISKKYTELQEKGHLGQQKLAIYTRYWSLIFGFLTGLVIMFTNDLSTLLSVQINLDITERFLLAIILSIGALFVNYLGDLINENGIGNGQSLLITTGIITNFPYEIGRLFNEENFIRTNNFYISLSIMIISYVFIILFTYIINKKEYRLPLQSKMSLVNFKAHYLPIKLLASSVVPVIFATSILTILSTIATVYHLDWKFLDYTNWTGMIIYSILIFLFTYLYNFVQIDSQKISQDLVKSGIYLINVEDINSRNFLNKKILHLSNVGAPLLTILAVSSIIISKFTPVDLQMSLTGISLLIVVATLQELYSQIKGLTDKNNYKELI